LLTAYENYSKAKHQQISQKNLSEVLARIGNLINIVSDFLLEPEVAGLDGTPRISESPFFCRICSKYDI
jgi:hypothetical protein